MSHLLPKIGALHWSLEQENDRDKVNNCKKNVMKGVMRDWIKNWMSIWSCFDFDKKYIDVRAHNHLTTSLQLREYGVSFGR